MVQRAFDEMDEALTVQNFRTPPSGDSQEMEPTDEEQVAVCCTTVALPLAAPPPALLHTLSCQIATGGRLGSTT